MDMGDFEDTVLHGSLESTTPEMFVQAHSRIDELFDAYTRRREEYQRKWQVNCVASMFPDPRKLPIRMRMRTAHIGIDPDDIPTRPETTFVEASLPNGDRG